MREEAGVPAAGWIPVDSPGPWGSPSSPRAQGPKAHADVQLKHVTHSAPPSDEQTSPALSRTRLARETGLSKATVPTLVAERYSRGLLIEEKPDLSGNVGRSSSTVRYSLGWHDVAIASHDGLDA